MPKTSICIATYNKAPALNNTLESIFAQNLSDTEVIVVDDGSAEPDTENVCRKFDLQYHRVERKPVYRNPAVARNIAYRLAKGTIIIAQSDDVMHGDSFTIEKLTTLLTPGHFVIATVINVDHLGHELQEKHPVTKRNISYYTGPKNKRPLFFLGSLFRKDLYAIGGNDEDFIYPGREDVWFGMCLMHGLKLSPIYTDQIKGYHQAHRRVLFLTEIQKSVEVYNQKMSQGVFCSSSGPWTFSEG